MISKVIEEISKIENATAEKLIAIFQNKQEEVAEDFYASTVFESEENYKRLKGYLNGKVVGSVQRKIIETPLVFIRSKEQPVFCSADKQGIAFGFTMVDYRSSKPLVIAVIDKVDENYEYKSIMYDKESNTYIDSESISGSCAELEALITMFVDAVNKDADKWIGKY
jgi:hypothetical protein